MQRALCGIFHDIFPIFPTCILWDPAFTEKLHKPLKLEILFFK